MRILAFAAALLTIALFAAAATSRSYSVLALVSSALGIVSALAFLVALAPPAVVRMVWRRPAQERVQDAVRDLITLSRSQAEVAARVLGPMADIVGARALCIRNNEGELVGSYGLEEDAMEPAHTGDAQQFELDIRPRRVAAARDGRRLHWSRARPRTPVPARARGAART
jgi:hypothetical protein